MRKQTGFTVIQKGAQIHARVPVGREIVDSTFRQDSLKNTDEIRFEANWKSATPPYKLLASDYYKIERAEMSKGRTQAWILTRAYILLSRLCKRVTHAVGVSELFRNGNARVILIHIYVYVVHMYVCESKVICIMAAMPRPQWRQLYRVYNTYWPWAMRAWVFSAGTWTCRFDIARWATIWGPGSASGCRSRCPRFLEVGENIEFKCEYLNNNER